MDGRDVGEVAAAVLTGKGHEGKAYELTGPEALDTGEVLTLIGQALGHQYTYVPIPDEAARKAMADMQMPAWLVDGMAELAGLIRNGWSETPGTGVKDVLGRPPRSFKDSLKDYAAGKV